MKYLAAFALVQLSGKAPAKADVQAVLKAAGVAIDADRVNSLFAEFEGKDFTEVSNAGKAKLVGAGSGAYAAAPSAGAATSAAAAAAPAAAEEEEDDEMGFGLFD